MFVSWLRIGDLEVRSLDTIGVSFSIEAESLSTYRT